MIVAGFADWTRVLRRLAPLLIGLFAYDVAVSVLVVYYKVRIAITDLPLPLLGSALGLFLGLRNNLAYNRWWEARTLWGAVTNQSRSLARALIAVAPEFGATREILRLQIAWAHTLRCRLRGQDPFPEIAALVPEEALARVRATTNPVVGIQNEQARLIRDALRAGEIDTIGAAQLDRVLGELANAQGGLERIRNTPLPRHFDLFAQLFVVAFYLLLPIGLVTDLGILTPIGSTFLGFIFIMLERLGRDLEHPFANTDHDVPMLAITRTIEIDLRQSFGDADTPPMLAPVKNVLW